MYEWIRTTAARLVQVPRSHFLLSIKVLLRIRITLRLSTRDLPLLEGLARKHSKARREERRNNDYVLLMVSCLIVTTTTTTTHTRQGGEETVSHSLRAGRMPLYYSFNSITNKQLPYGKRHQFDKVPISFVYPLLL